MYDRAVSEEKKGGKRGVAERAYKHFSPSPIAVKRGTGRPKLLIHFLRVQPAQNQAQALGCNNSPREKPQFPVAISSIFTVSFKFPSTSIEATNPPVSPVGLEVRWGGEWGTVTSMSDGKLVAGIYSLSFNHCATNVIRWGNLDADAISLLRELEVRSTPGLWLPDVGEVWAVHMAIVTLKRAILVFMEAKLTPQRCRTKVHKRYHQTISKIRGQEASSIYEGLPPVPVTGTAVVSTGYPRHGVKFTAVEVPKKKSTARP
ncbi:hypothetical protein C8R47DRAFT_1063581 [Mycena vitilis]|nr:hypothetical protein C8R47DRAFT_1063581 [Mycena vitilis]